MKLLIFTAEAKNFVPVKIKEAAEKKGIHAEIVDVTELMLMDGPNSQIMQVIKDKEVKEDLEPVDPQVAADPKVVPLNIDNETVIIPRLNEHHLDVKLSMLKRAQNFGAHLVNTPESMELCNDKLMSQVTLTTAGILTPITFTVPGDEELLAQAVDFVEASGMKYPMILKTLRGTHGIGVMRVDSKASLMSVAQTLCKEGMDILIQEYIEHDHSLRMIMTGDQLLAANKRGQPKGNGEFRTNAHLGSETEAYEPSKSEVEMGRKIVQLFGCNFCAIDYILQHDDRDAPDTENGGDKIIVLEVNGSPGLENIQSNYPDRDLAASVVEYVMGTPVPKGPDVVVDVPQEAPAEPVPAEVAPISGETTDAVATSQDNEVQEIERVLVHRIMETETDARVDTGAKTSSLHVDENLDFDDSWTKFRRGDITYKVPTARIVKIKNVHGGDNSRRPVIKLDVSIKGQRFNGVEFSLNNREQMKYQVIVGRNLLALMGLPVAVRQPAEAPDSNAPESEVEEE